MFHKSLIRFVFGFLYLFITAQISVRFLVLRSSIQGSGTHWVEASGGVCVRFGGLGFRA